MHTLCISLVAAVAGLLLVGCAASGQRGPRAATVPMTFIYLETGPNSASHTREQKSEIFKGHMANMQRLADEKTLLIAGPFGTPREKAWRGIFVFDVADPAKAREVAATDPGVIAGEFVTRVRPIAAPTETRDMPRLEEALQAELKAGGQPERKAGEPPAGLRGYVMMHAEDFAKARAALRASTASPRVLWAARFLDGSDGVLILDSTEPGAAAAALSTIDAGPHGLDRWMSTTSVERLGVEPSITR